MSNLATKSKTDLAAAYNRAVSTIKNAKGQARAMTGRTVGTALCVGTGWAVGAARAKMGEGTEKKLLVPGTKIEADLAAGILLTLAGIVGLADDYSDELCAVGGGALTAYAAISAFNNPISFGEDEK